MDRYVFFWKCVLVFICGWFTVAAIDEWEKYCRLRAELDLILDQLELQETYNGPNVYHQLNIDPERKLSI